MDKFLGKLLSITNDIHRLNVVGCSKCNSSVSFSPRDSGSFEAWTRANNKLGHRLFNFSPIQIVMAEDRMYEWAEIRKLLEEE